MSNNKLEITRRTLLGIGGAAALGYPLRAFAGMPQAAAPPQAPSIPGVKIDKDVVVGKGGDADLKVDIYHPPAGTEKHMALIHLYGGGFARGNKEGLAGKVTPITGRGYVSIAATYRLTGVAKWPAQIEDVKTTIRWARANATSLGIDPKLIATVGYSAGGLLSLYAGGQDDTQLAAVVGFYAVTHLDKGSNLAKTLLPDGDDDAAVRAASPITYVKTGYPPTILFHGLADVTVPPESSIDYLQALRAAKVPSELHTFAGVPHEFDGNPEFAAACAPLTDFFLDRYVVNPRTYPGFGAGRGGAGGAGRGGAGGGAGRGEGGRGPAAQ